MRNELDLDRPVRPPIRPSYHQESSFWRVLAIAGLIVSGAFLVILLVVINR